MGPGAVASNNSGEVRFFFYKDIDKAPDIKMNTKNHRFILEK
jgi:hypothetical protein